VQRCELLQQQAITRRWNTKRRTKSISQLAIHDQKGIIEPRRLHLSFNEKLSNRGGRRKFHRCLYLCDSTIIIRKISNELPSIFEEPFLNTITSFLKSRLILPQQAFHLALFHHKRNLLEPEGDNADSQLI